MGCALPSISSTSCPEGVNACKRNIHKCGMKFRVTPLSGLYSRIRIFFCSISHLLHCRKRGERNNGKVRRPENGQGELPGTPTIALCTLAHKAKKPSN